MGDGRPYLVTEFCGGGSLADHVDAVGRLTPDEACRVGAKVAAALGAAHRLGIFHRDITPANVLINADGEPLLADFGLLSVAIADRSPAIRVARRAFTAPEAYLPELMSAASDIFALGATLYALLAGTPATITPAYTGRRGLPRVGPWPYIVDGDSVPDLPGVPRELMRLLRRAMAHNPRDRFASAEQFLAALLAVERRS